MLTFGDNSTGALTLNNDRMGLSLAGITFNAMIANASAYVLYGNAITLTGGGITDNFVGTNTINLATTLAGSQTITTATGATLVMGGAISGSGADLTVAGTGTVILSAANTYDGITTVSGGTLQFAKQVSLYNNTTASWTAANLVVASGATAAFNVGGTGEFTSANIATLAVLGTSSGGFVNGSFIGLDTTNASGRQFPPPTLALSHAEHQRRRQ